jgi:site-specific DNA-methyltransferase (adenine-specific)
MNGDLPLDEIIHGDCIEVLATLPEKSVDLIFADPPYNLQLRNTLWRPNMTQVDAVNDRWDHFESNSDYSLFSQSWLSACKRVLKDTGTIWVIGTYHNIYRIGAIIQDLGYWILNDVVWIKTNPMPNFRGVRLANAHETLIWASKSKGARYTFNHHAMKGFNEGKQLRSDWPIPRQFVLPICSGAERIRIHGKKAHSTQKPEALLMRILVASTRKGDVILDPFFGTGTTGAVAKRLHRHWIGIEREDEYVKIAEKRIRGIEPMLAEPLAEDVFDVSDKRRLAPRVGLANLLETGYLVPGQKLYFQKEPRRFAYVKPDGNLRLPDGLEGSIHQAGKHLMGGSPCNGWQNWYYKTEGDELVVIDELREGYRAKFIRSGTD